MTSEALISAASIGGNMLLTWINTKSNKRNQTVSNVANNTIIVSLQNDSHDTDWKCVAVAFIVSTGLLSLLCLALLVHHLLYRRRYKSSENVV